MQIRDIQKLTGYSPGTISRVLNGKAKAIKISDKAIQLILQTAEAHHYRPNILARSLRIKKTMTVGLLVSDILNPFFGRIAARVEQLLRDHGYVTILCNTNEDPEDEQASLQLLLDRQVDGIIIAPVAKKLWPALNGNGIKPVILLDRMTSRNGMPCVASDHTRAAEKMTAELIRSGCRRIAYFGGKKDSYINEMRSKGYRKAHLEYGIEPQSELVFFEGYGIDDGTRMVKRLFDNELECDGVFCVNNLVFLGMMGLLWDYEETIGKQLRIAAFDIGDYCALYNRPLISADQDTERIAQAAVCLLIGRISASFQEREKIILPIIVAKFEAGEPPKLIR